MLLPDEELDEELELLLDEELELLEAAPEEEELDELLLDAPELDDELELLLEEDELELDELLEVVVEPPLPVQVGGTKLPSWLP